MTTLSNQQVVLAARPDGDLKPSDLRLEDVAVPIPGEREVLLETIYLSIDPYMRWWMRAEKSYNEPIEIDQVIVGATVSRVRESHHPDWPVGAWVLAFSGWKRFAISDGSDLRQLDPDLAPPSTALGVLGMTGFTAYAGLRNIGKPNPGETVVVAAASYREQITHGLHTAPHALIDQLKGRNFGKTIVQLGEP
ncbi:NADP-dependent oxidoreductase [Pseudomonas sp. Wu6]|uniref:MDR family NADP-dependent oxidoreductase n=1 Tax=Pseudomonas sp. Wu6 TaxID=1210129 RepID=UPI001CA71575|nr:NADP-dependent oxidoreductase [Pseudomonas sp. Wu6]MBY8929548.1 NADP-dependent oxidoreductase [Pseudomonas sp. Wu6]